LLAELRRRAPAAIDRGSLSAAGVVQMLDDFEVAQEARPARLALIDAAVEAAELSRRRKGAWVG
jgi:hypothetical protein